MNKQAAKAKPELHSSPSAKTEEPTPKTAAKTSGEENGAAEEDEERLAINVYHTKYDLIREVARDEFGFKVIEEEPGEEEWDLMWFDFGVNPRLLQKMHTF